MCSKFRKNFKKIELIALGFAAAVALINCGVKGDPLPPEKTIELGHGHANYAGAFAKRKAEDSAQSVGPSKKKVDDDEDQDEKEEGSEDNAE